MIDVNVRGSRDMLLILQRLDEIVQRTSSLSVFSVAANTAEHFGHFIRSKSIRTISAGETEYPHTGQVAFKRAKTFFKSIFLRCITAETYHLYVANTRRKHYFMFGRGARKN